MKWYVYLLVYSFSCTSFSSIGETEVSLKLKIPLYTKYTFQSQYAIPLERIDVQEFESFRG